MSKDKMYKTPNGHDWSCNDKKCQEMRDEWEDSSADDLVHCGNPDNCHGVLWLDKDGVACEICSRYYCQTCAYNLCGRYTDIYSDLTRKQLKGYDEDQFLCYECVPKNKLRKHDKK
jgi:hypothetical protein